MADWKNLNPEQELLRKKGQTDTSGNYEIQENVPFKVYTDTDEYDVDRRYSFAPQFPPDRFRVRKVRNLEADDKLCDGQDVTDNGSENKNIHVSGVIVSSFELMAFEEILDLNVPVEVDTMGEAFEGEVRVDEGEYEGPIGIDADHHQSYHWRYSMDLISTGRDEYDNHIKDGILESGN